MYIVPTVGVLWFHIVLSICFVLSIFYISWCNKIFSGRSSHFRRQITPPLVWSTLESSIGLHGIQGPLMTWPSAEWILTAMLTQQMQPVAVVLVATLLMTNGERAIRHLLSRQTHLEFQFVPLLTVLLVYFLCACWSSGTSISSGLVVPML